MVVSHPKTLPLLEDVKKELKKSKVIQELFEENNLDLEIIDYIPMAFTDLDVSARTDKGCIYFNYDLFENFLDKHLHYATHECVHFVQQCFGDGPTQGADDGEYLENKFEQEGFQAQLEYLADTEGRERAHEYVDQVLDHHELDGSDRKKIRKKLLKEVESRCRPSRIMSVSSIDM